MDSQTLITVFERELKEKVDSTLTVSGIDTLGGGSINTSLLIRTSLGNFFSKYNDAVKYPGMFAAEAKNLDILTKTRTVKIPRLIAQFTHEDKDFLLLEYIDAGTPHYDFWSDFGRKLADLHKNTAPQYGLEYNNFVGSLHQDNRASGDWIDFFITHRIQPNLEMAFNSGKADAELIRKFEGLYKKLPEIFPTEQPSLLHGDLWSGNAMADIDGDPVIFDPAVYYGHREMDLAMSKLFGGFSEEFYEAYHEAYPLEKHWTQRIAICNLYPLLIHVNLFAGSYVQSIKNIVNLY